MFVVTLNAPTAHVYLEQFGELLQDFSLMHHQKDQQSRTSVVTSGLTLLSFNTLVHRNEICVQVVAIAIKQ